MGAGFACGNVDNREKNNEIDDINLSVLFPNFWY